MLPLTTIVLVQNIHCGSCVTYIQEILSHVPGIIAVEVSLVTQEVRVTHRQNVKASRICQSLSDAAFESDHATTTDATGKQVEHLEPSQHLELLSSSTQHQKHAENCESCKKEGLSQHSAHTVLSRSSKFSKLLGSSSAESKAAERDKETKDRTQETEPGESCDTSDKKEKDEAFIIQVDDGNEGQTEYSATLTLGGMTCASCVRTIEQEVSQLKFVRSIDVTLLQNSAKVIFNGPEKNVDQIIEAIEDVGYDATINLVSPKSQLTTATRKPPGFKFTARISIEGMTCSSCVSTITQGVKELSIVNNVAVDLISNSAKVEFEGQDHIDEIVGKIEDLGYDATVASCDRLDPADDRAEHGLMKRTILIRVNGMFCDHCPPKVLDALQKFSNGTVEVEKALTYKIPIVKLTYTPRPPSFTIRDIIHVINLANESFKAEIYHPPTIEERSRAIQQRERWRLMYRLLFTFVVAIPTFLFGVVWMSLVSSKDSVRKYLEEPAWAGRATRSEWALFILATPVMAFGADVFHIRAVKEIHALWRRNSKVPILRRFYRFGSMNLLISAGTAVAYFSSLALLIVNATSKPMNDDQITTYFDTVVFLTFFILIGKYLEAYSKAKTGDAVAMLGKLRPSEALLITTLDKVDSTSTGSSEVEKIGAIKRFPVDLIEVGDHVQVPHGASPPADGIIDTSDFIYQFDESTLTGESMPVNKSTGDKVFAGSMNTGQPVRITVTDIGGTSMLDQIVSVVREGQAKRAPVERVADIITGYFVPVITALAIATFLIWFGLGQGGILPQNYYGSGQGGWAFWSLEFAIAVFVVACPCGLGLAAPTALFVGGGLAAKHGILVRGGGDAFQEASHVDAIVFDKTGTLTEGGNMKVTDHEILPSDEDTETVAWVVTKAMEQASNHPIAKAIADFCETKPSATLLSSDFEEIPGQGMKGSFTLTAGKETSGQCRYEAVIGNERLYQSLPLSNSASRDNQYYLQTLLSKYQSAGKSTALLSLRQLDQMGESPSSPYTPTFIFATSDPLRATTPAIINNLQTNHSSISLHICTGDNPSTASAVASILNIPATNVLSSASPTQKADYIRSLQEPSIHNSKKKRTVAFVGDGTNDAPALASASVSIALSSGTDIAVSSASFVLLSSDLTPLPHLLSLSKKVFNRVKLNFLWAAIYNVCLIPVAAGVFYPIGGHWRLGPVWASAAMAASSVSVVMSSLALRWF